jgi:hypothetical protein
LLHPLLYVVDFKRALGFGEAQAFALDSILTRDMLILLGKTSAPVKM